jgi:hypothetical protein
MLDADMSPAVNAAHDSASAADAGMSATDSCRPRRSKAKPATLTLRSDDGGDDGCGMEDASAADKLPVTLASEGATDVLPVRGALTDLMKQETAIKHGLYGSSNSVFLIIMFDIFEFMLLLLTFRMSL